MPASPSVPAGGSQFLSACARYYTAIAAAVLCLTALNLGVRLASENVTEWDEAFYATSAAEMVSSGDWVGTTIQGELDYYNTKPPLNVWLIAVSFKMFGVNLVSLRLVSACAAWLTVCLLMWWARRLYGPAVSVLAGAVLCANFGFVYVHAGRSANTDALLALLVLLTAMTLWAAREVPVRAVWLGPLMAAVFLLKGMTVLMPLLIVALVALGTWRAQTIRWRYVLIGLPLFVAPIAVWAVLRWRVDGWDFLSRVVGTDFVGHAFDVLDRHEHGIFFYVNQLQKHEYSWLVAVLATLLAAPMAWSQWRAVPRRLRDLSSQQIILGAWAAATFLIPTLMGTKLPWYLNSFYPAFALGTAWLLVRGLSQVSSVRRRVLLGAFVAVVFVAAEARLAWYSLHNRDLGSSVQGLMLAERSGLASHVVFGARWDHADRFVLSNVVEGQASEAQDPDDFLRRSRAGDFLLWRDRVSQPGLTLVSTNGRQWLYRRDVVRAGLY